MKKLLTLILALLMILGAFVACDDEESSSESSGSESSSETTNPNTESEKTEQSSTKDEPSKGEYPEVPKVEYNVNINQTVNTNIFANLDSFGNEGEAVDYSNATPYDISKGLNNITQPGVYRLYGTTTKGHVNIDIERIDETAPLEKVILVFDNISITSYPDASSIPPIKSKGCDLTIILPKGTTSQITDTKTNTEKGAIYVKTGNLTIEGEGTLKVTAVHKSAIFNSKTLTINGGIFDLTAEYHGIYGEENLVINSGDFTITSGKSGLKSGEFEEDNIPEDNVLGSITLNGGKHTINSIGNSIDCYGSVTVNGGGYSLKSSKDGINATETITFANDETNTVMIIDAKEDGIKIKSKTVEAGATIVPDVKITGKTNIKIQTIHDGIDATDVEIDMDGVLYIKTDAKFVEDKSHGEYIIDSKEYYKVDRTLYDGKAFFSIDGSSKGIIATNSITIKGGNIGIDSDEDSIVTTDGKNGDSKTINAITISGGTLFLDSRESAIKADNSITVSAYAKISIIKSDKGLNAKAVVVKDGSLNIVAVSDAIDSNSVTIEGGTTYLFDKVDLPAEGGVFEVKGGTLVCISTTKNPKAPTSSASKVISKAIENSSGYSFGSFISISGEDFEVVFKLPKKYTEKVSVVVTAPAITAGDYEISVGTYEDGSVSNLVCSGGLFTATSTEKVTIE